MLPQGSKSSKRPASGEASGSASGPKSSRSRRLAPRPTDQETENMLYDNFVRDGYEDYDIRCRIGLDQQTLLGRATAEVRQSHVESRKLGSKIIAAIKKDHPAGDTAATDTSTH